MKVKVLNLLAGFALILWSVLAIVYAFTLFEDSLATVFALFLIIQSLLIALLGLKVLRNKFIGRVGLLVGASVVGVIMFLGGYSLATLNFQAPVVFGLLIFTLGHTFSKYNFKLVPGIVFGVIAVAFFFLNECMSGGFLALRSLFASEGKFNVIMLSLSHYAALISVVLYVVSSILNSSEENTAEVEKIKKDKKEFFEEVPEGKKRRKKSVAILCAWLLGFWGGLAFYEGKFAKGIIKAFTINYFLVGYFIDIVYAMKLPKYYEVE